MSEKGFYLDKPLQLADRVERLGYYLNEEAAALIRKQYAEIEALRAERDALREALEEAVRAEREACAKFVDHILKEGGGTYGDAIRKIGQKA